MSVRILGAGAYVPETVVTNDEIVAMVPAWPSSKIAEKTGILERRFLWKMDQTAGVAVEPEGPVKTGVDMSELALKEALDMSAADAKDLDALIMVTCTPDEINFSSDAMHLAARMNMRSDMLVIQMDSGCGGAQYLLKHVHDLIKSGIYRRVALVAHNRTSALVQREMYVQYADFGDKKLGAFLSPYIFGDGAGAIIIGRNDEPSPVSSGFVSTYFEQRLVEYMLRPGGGGNKPPHSPRTKMVDHAFIIDGALVAKGFPIFMTRALKGVLRGHENLLPQVDMFLLHQANMLLVKHFASLANLPLDRVPMHMDRYGNTSAAGTLILFAEELRKGNIALGSGQLVLFAAIGAGAHYGASLIRL